MKRVREERIEEGEITNTQILDELSILKEELLLAKEEKEEITRQLSESIMLRDKYKTRLKKRKERTKKIREDLMNEPQENINSDYVELKYEVAAKKEKWKQEKNKWQDRVERLEVKIEALKEENGRLVVSETRLRSDYERKLITSSEDQNKIHRYKDELKQLEDSLRNSEEAFHAADALQREQEKITEQTKRDMKQMEEMIKLRDDKITTLQMAASRAAQQLTEAARDKNTLEKQLQAANTKFHEQMKVDAQKLTNLMNDLAEKTRTINEHKNAALHTSAKLQMMESSEQSYQNELTRGDERLLHMEVSRLQAEVGNLQNENVALTQQLALRNGGPGEAVFGIIENVKKQNFSLNAELQRFRGMLEKMDQENEMERMRMMDEIQALRGGKGGGQWQQKPGMGYNNNNNNNNNNHNNNMGGDSPNGMMCTNNMGPNMGPNMGNMGPNMGNMGPNNMGPNNMGPNFMNFNSPNGMDNGRMGMGPYGGGWNNNNNNNINNNNNNNNMGMDNHGRMGGHQNNRNMGGPYRGGPPRNNNFHGNQNFRRYGNGNG